MPATDRSIQLAQVAAAASEDKKALTIAGIDVSEHLPLADVFLVVSASNERQVGAIVDGVEDALRELGVKPLRREGQREGRWVLIDFGDVVVHVQHEDEHHFYDLERLWKDGPQLDLGLPTREPRAGQG